MNIKGALQPANPPSSSCLTVNNNKAMYSFYKRQDPTRIFSINVAHIVPMKNIHAALVAKVVEEAAAYNLGRCIIPLHTSAFAEKRIIATIEKILNKYDEKAYSVTYTKESRQIIAQRNKKVHFTIDA